jgi:hypothetical protein
MKLHWHGYPVSSLLDNCALSYTLLLGLTVIFASREIFLTKYIYKYINIYDTKLISLCRYLNLVFLTKLVGDTNVARILHKFGQTCGTSTSDDYHYETKGVINSK